MGKDLELGEFDLDCFLNQEECVVVETPKENHLYVILGIDASNSMRGYKIGAVNDVVNNTISRLKSFDKGADCSVQIAVVGFSERLFRWTNGFVPATDFKFSYVEMVDGKTDICGFIDELVRLTQSVNAGNADHICAILFSDGLPTTDYEQSISAWRSCSNYSKVKRIAVSFDDDIEDSQSREMLEAFANSGIILSIKRQDDILSEILNS